MFDFIFSSNSDWSWGTFFLYYFVSIVVVALCKAGVNHDVCDNGNSVKRSKSGNLYYVIAFIILVLLATVRSDQVGSDTWKYIETFNNISKNDFQFDWARMLSFYEVEPGYQYFIISVKSISENYHVLFLCLYSLVSFSYLYFIRHFLQKGISSSFLKLFILFYVANMSGMRSALATVPFLFSLVSLEKKSFVYSFLFSTLAVLCHYTMIFNYAIIMGYYVLAKWPKLWNSKNIVLLMVGSLAIAVAGSGSLLGMFADTKYSFYTENLNNLTLTGSIFYAIFGVLLYFSKNGVQQNTRMDSLLKIAGLFTLAYPIIFVTGAYRIPNYYALPRLIMWCYFVSYFFPNKKSNPIVTVGVEAVVFVYMLFRFYQSALDGFFTYQI